jgi:hypothetical protein
MMRRGIVALVAVIAWLSLPQLATAGMPSLTLTDIARMRIETISFFLACLLLSAWAVKVIWNSLRSDFPRLPWLSYRTAIGIVALWGLLFVLVLTMISGARELMTPGAWKKVGVTYSLPTDSLSKPPANSSNIDHKVRVAHLKRLREALWRSADAHNGDLPPTTSFADVPEDLWRVPDPSEMRYIYVGGQRRGTSLSVVAYEPDIFDAEVNVLLANGEIRTMTVSDLRRALEADAERQR